jgi:hypothetical protein
MIPKPRPRSEAAAEAADLLDQTSKHPGTNPDVAAATRRRADQLRKDAERRQR